MKLANLVRVCLVVGAAGAIGCPGRKPAADTPTSETPTAGAPGTPTPAVPLGPAKPLADDDRVLLQLAGDRYFLDGVGVIPNPAAHADLLARELTAPSNPARGRLARCAAVAGVCRAVIDLEPVQRGLLTATLPTAARAAAIDIALAGLPRGFDLTLGELRAAGVRLDDHIDRLRRAEIGKWKSRVCWHQAAANAADAARPEFAARAGAADLAGVLRVERAAFDLRSDYKYPNFEQWDPYATVKNVGGSTLTNVVIFKLLTTAGAAGELSTNQARLVAFNKLAGYADQAAEVDNLFTVQNYHNTMPKAGYVYIPELKPGAVAKVCLYSADRESVRDGRVEVVCDQGRLAEQVIPLAYTPPGQIKTGPDGAGGPRSFPGPHVGRWEAIGYEDEEGKTPASMVWLVRADGTIDVTYPLVAKPITNRIVYAVDDTKSPKQIDLTATAGPIAGKVRQGIFKIENDVLVICAPKESADDVQDVPRPTSFDVSRRRVIQLLRLKRTATP